MLARAALRVALADRLLTLERPTAGSAARWLLRTVRRPGLQLFVAGAVLVVMLTAMLVVDGPIAIGVVIYSPVAVPLLVLALTYGRSVIAARDSLVEDAERAMLSASLCPCCGYNLGGLDAQTDGRVSCPECDAAWFAGRIGRSGREVDVVVIPFAAARSDDSSVADDVLDRVLPELVREHPFVAVAEKDQVGALTGDDAATVGEPQERGGVHGRCPDRLGG